jgi:regulation of enolase protein 1 (concanavalin A-like superfamily)
MPLTSFQRVQLSISADYAQRYDQGGFVLKLTHPDASKQDKWLKAGVEFFNGKPMVSTVGTWAWSDWSVAPVVKGEGGEWVTVEAVRQGDELGSGLWVYQIVDGETVPLREVAWFFAEEDQGWEVEVGAYAAKPSSEGGELVVSFRDMQVEKVE